MPKHGPKASPSFDVLCSAVPLRYSNSNNNNKPFLSPSYDAATDTDDSMNKECDYVNLLDALAKQSKAMQCNAMQC